MHTGVHLGRTYTGNVLLRTIKAATTVKQEDDPLLTTHRFIKMAGKHRKLYFTDITL